MAIVVRRSHPFAMKADHPLTIRLLDTVRAGDARAPHAALDLLELLEPPTLEPHAPLRAQPRVGTIREPR